MVGHRELRGEGGSQRNIPRRRTSLFGVSSLYQLYPLHPSKPLSYRAVVKSTNGALQAAVGKQTYSSESTCEDASSPDQYLLDHL